MDAFCSARCPRPGTKTALSRSKTSAKGSVGGASRVLRWVPDSLPLRGVYPRAGPKAGPGGCVTGFRESAVEGLGAALSTSFPGACSVSGMRPGTQRKTLPRSGAELISRRPPVGPRFAPAAPNPQRPFDIVAASFDMIRPDARHDRAFAASSSASSSRPLPRRPGSGAPRKVG
jgi:hypothetical protein